MTKQELRPFWLGLSAGTMMAVLAAASFFASSETVLRSSFATALTRTAAPQAKEVASAAPPVSGSEDFWLTAMRRDGSSPVTKTISVGDQISLTLSGQHRTFQVATVADFAPQITEIDTSASPSHFVLVTARDVRNSSAPPVRFVMEIDGGNAPIVAGRAGRTL
ncbi:MAG TPA: hypothetical protein VIF13_04215 [Hyphomicrobium sp.]|jgi:hypothetical protein